MSETINVDVGDGQLAEWQTAAAFNTYWQYTWVNRAAFYANIKSEYKEYMYRWVQNYLWWNDGWVPYFHNSAQGIFSTKIASALVNGAAKKVVGGRIFFKTKNRETDLKKDDKGHYEINQALSYIASTWAPASNFSREVKKAVAFAAAAGTSLLKLDKQSGNNLTIKALRFDSFYPTVGANGKVIDLLCFIRDFTQLVNVRNSSQRYTNFYVVEHRYFGDYTRLDGEVRHNVPLVKYEIRRTTGTITTGQNYNISVGETVDFKDLPRGVRSDIGKAFSGISFSEPIPLPFDNHLGAELVNWTDCVSAIPELPFGDSLLYNIMPYLMSYDYYWSAFNTDMYTARARVLMPLEMKAPNSEKVKVQGNYNAGYDSFLFTKIPMNGNGQEIKPTPLQFDLRSQSWTEIRTMIIQNIAINSCMNLSTIASFLPDDTAAPRTAQEISTEEYETALFVDDKREIIERPINRILRLVTLFYGFTDEIVIRWSAAGLSNIYSRTQMIAQALSNGFISQKKAIQMFNQDDDEYQLQEEYDRVEEEQATRQNSLFGE